MFDVVAIGSATRDVFLEGDFKTIPYRATPSGRALVFPFGEKLGVKKAYFTIGGNAANTSITFARQGFKTAIVAPIGSDVSGEETRRRLKKEGVDISYISVTSRPTAYSVLLLEGGERTILNYPGASNEFSLANVPLHRLAARWWYVSLPGEEYRYFGKLLRAAKRIGVKVALNPSMSHIINNRKELLHLLPDISFLVLNEGEASALAGISFKKAEAVFKKLDKLMPGIVAVTSGPAGATISDGKFIYRAGIFKEKRLVDRTGAGDAFGSGFVAGLLRKNDVEYAIRLASANATAAVEEIGATEGLLTRREFESARRFATLKIVKQRINNV
jgi:sugar/nucleoside kinase (ribokinase family)